ncbi:MAG: LacI family DNA-binding transcriptional regulator [Eubacterium sp.]|nr:LacI family DNA-binding transcriptional regulator [Eubacterium sp.]
MKSESGTVTIRDISRKCGVSVSTVSKALNHYGDVGSETAERIRQTAREMHYVPNTAARLLKTNISHSIGVLFVDQRGSGLTHEYFAAILDAVRDEAEKKGYDITFIGRNLGGEPMSYLEHCRYRKCDGVVIANVDFESRAVTELVKSEVSVVTIDYAYDSISCVMSDNMNGGYELASYLIRMGHRKIAYIHGEATSVTNKRLVGFNRAMTAAGIEVPPEYLVEGRYHDPETSARATRGLMKLPDPPTAILYPDDFSYLGGMSELEKMHLSVPQDISVAAYDGIPTGQVLRPKLTTYRQNAEEIGRRSVRKLLETIEHRRTCVPEEIPVSGGLLEGSSVARLD